MQAVARWRHPAAILLCLAALGARADGGVPLYRGGLAALEANARAHFASFRLALSGHPLAPYLDYARLREDIDRVPAEAVTRLVERHGDLAVTPRLRVAWLRELARRGDWARLRRTYAGERDVHVRCALVEAHRDAGDTAAAVRVALALWHVGYRQPGRCNAAFDFLESQGELTEARLLERMLLALEAGNPGLVRAYRPRLPEASRARVDRWLEIWADPAAVRDIAPAELGPQPARSRVLAAALERLARADPEAARALLPEAERHAVDAAARGRVERTSALWGVYGQHPDGLTWLQALPDTHSDAIARAWRVRAALRRGEWPAVRSAVARMPESQAREPVWRYWLGRALAAEGREARAAAAYREAAERFGYYGFLAADALETAYRWGPPGPEAADALPALPALARALALKSAEEPALARLEWRQAMAVLTPEERLAAARRASSADWPWAAMHASGRAGAGNASALRFPFGFREAVEAAARRHDVDADWLFALIRQESAFGEGRCSRSGACGLTQLMPGTAAWLLERAGEDGSRLATLLQRPATNIDAGARYLAHLRGRFESPAVALAAYNAGPGSVRRWLDGDTAPLPGSARWVETLPFGETRGYVQAVLFNRTVYRLRLTGGTQRLNEILHTER